MAQTLDLGNLLVHLRADSAQYITAMKRAEAKMKSFTAATKRYAKVATAALGAATVASIKAFSSFEEQLANISTMLDETSMKYMPSYERALKQMAVEFGESTKTLSKGLYDILSASVAPAKAIDVLTASVKAAKAGMTDTGVAADALTTIINSYGMAAEDADRISDVLFAVVKRGKTTFAELAPKIGMVSSIASTAGLSLEELGAALSTMTRAGLQTDIAITSLRGVLNSFLKPGEEAIRVARQFGLEMNSTTLQAEGLTGVLEKLKGASAEQLAAIFPNVRALSGMAAMLKNVKEQAEDLKFMMNATGLTQQAYEKMTRTLAHTLRRLWQVIKIVSVAVGERFAPAVKAITKKIIENKRIIEDWAIAFADRIVFVGQVIKNFLVVMKTDWKKGFQAAANTALEIFIGLGKSLVVIMKDAGIKIANTFIQSFGESLGRWLAEVGRPEGILGKISMLSPAIAAGRIAIMKAGVGLAEAAKRPEVPTDLRGELETIWKTVESELKRLESELDIDILSGPLEELRRKAEQAKETLQPVVEEIEKIKEEAAAGMKNVVKTVEVQIKGLIEKAAPLFQGWVDQYHDTMKSLETTTSNALEGISGALTDMVMKGKADFKSLARSIMADLTQMIIRAQLAQIAMRVFGITPTPIPSLPVYQVPAPVPVGHAGGVVGQMRDFRYIAPSIFNTAPRLHRGLAPDEVPTILQKGETVIPRGGAPVNIDVNVINETGVPMKQKGAPKWNGREWVVGIVTEEINQYGPLRQTIEGIGRKSG